MRYLGALLFLLFFHQLSAQTLEDFASGTLEMGDLGIEQIIDFVYDEDSYYFAINDFEFLNTQRNYTSIIQTDENFNILKRIDGLNGILKFLHFDGDSGYCLLGGNVKTEVENQYEILYMDLKTFEVSLMDSLINDSNTEIINWVRKEISNSTILAVGHLLFTTDDYSGYIDQYVMELTKDGKIKEFKSLGLKSEETGNILDFIYLPTLEAYLLAPSRSSDYFILLGKDYEIQQLIPNQVNFISKDNPKSEAVRWPTEVSLLHATEDTIHCLGGMVFAEHCYMVHVKLPLYDDSVGNVVNYQVDGLFEKSIATTQFDGPYLNWKTVHASSDSKNNTYIILSSAAKFYFPTIMDTSTIYIAKTNLDEWIIRSMLTHPIRA